MAGDERVDTASELQQLRSQLAAVAHAAECRNVALQRSRTRELALLQAEHLPALLHSFSHYLRESYQLKRVTVLLHDPQHEIRHLLLDAGRRPEDHPDVFFVDALVGLAPQFNSLRSPWLGAFRAADHGLLFPQAVDLESIAILPLLRQQRLVGSVNFASADLEHFTRREDGEFLAHLAVIASYCLENTINRARLLRSGLTDVLTGWHNRRYLQTRMREELSRARRDRTALTCMMLDIDHFKTINDTYGHLAGDQVLREVAQRIEGEVRGSDVTARYGGEEFAILLPQTKAADGGILAERIRASVADEPFVIAGQDCAITLSIGVAELRPAEQTGDFKALGEALIARADAALYAAKAAGRNRVVGG